MKFLVIAATVVASFVAGEVTSPFDTIKPFARASGVSQNLLDASPLAIVENKKNMRSEFSPVSGKALSAQCEVMFAIRLFLTILSVEKMRRWQVRYIP
jgi:hypothetical protein